MKLIISTALKNNYITRQMNDKKLVLFNSIEKIANRHGQQKTYTNSLIEFINKMISDINEKYSGELEIKEYTELDEISTSDELDMYIAQVVHDGKVKADIVIANSDKLGNTLITQQMTAHLIRSIKNNDTYLINNQWKKIIYFTYDYSNNIDDKLNTAIVIIKSAQSIGFSIIEMFPTGYLPSQYTSSQELISDLNAMKREGNNPHSGIILNVLEGQRNELVLRLPNIAGQQSKYYGFYLIAIYALNRPRLVYDLNNKPEDGTLKDIRYIYNQDIPLIDNQIQYDDNEIIEEEPENFIKGNNLLVYGAPGTGKSHDVNEKYPKFRRVTFYPDYDYTQFIGGLKPVRSGEDRKIDYKFVAGPFSRQLVKAFNNPQKNTGIIIEELNRANAPSVFGDIFQLLDRDETGQSEFVVENAELAIYLDNHTNQIHDFKNNGIYLPCNFSIVATMNPADQGVFPLDTAFKRRWTQIYQPIDWNHPALHREELAGFEKQWVEVGKIINDYLVNQFKIEEDHLFGQFFLTKEESLDIDKVASKFLGYLWHDVVRYNRSELFNENLKVFSDVIKAFKSEEYKEIFVPILEEKLR